MVRIVAAIERTGGLARRAVSGPANQVTATRAILAIGVTALVTGSFVRAGSIDALVTLAAVALALDAVDGPIARRTGTASAFGARFDMEVDAFLILILSIFVARSVGPWVLMIGAARYLLAGASWAWPWLREPTPPRHWCKVVAAIQGVVLTVGAADVLPKPMTTVFVVIALALLAESFGRQVWWSWRGRARRTESSPTRRAPALAR